MKNIIVLYFSILKATTNGYLAHRGFYNNSERYCEVICSKRNEFYKIIFSHDFAKAFWGYEYIEIEEHYDADKVNKDIKQIGKDFVLGEYTHTWKIRLPSWKFHLREMILEDEPLKYLKRFL